MITTMTSTSWVRRVVVAAAQFALLGGVLAASPPANAAPEDSTDRVVGVRTVDAPPSTRFAPGTDPASPVVAAPTRLILTPTETPATSQSFSWLAGDASHTSGQVQVRPSAGGDVRTVDAYATGTANGNPRRHFSTTVTGLDPATAYEYRVGIKGSWSRWQGFSTADPGETDFQFIYYGDTQIGLDSIWPLVVRQAEATAPDSIGSVHAGDLIDSATDETQWVDWFSGMADSAATANVMAAPGNHDFSGDRYLRAWKANFEYPHNNPTTETIGELADLAVGDSDAARQYAAYFAHWTRFATETVYFTDYQGVRFIAVNATQDAQLLSPASVPACAGDGCPSGRVAELWTQFQATWLDYVLEASPSKWNVVAFHQPVYSASAGRDEPILREYWVPVFEKHNVDLVMMGHDHTYARGYNNDDRTDVDGITNGPVYVVSNSGAKHYDLASDETNVWTRNNATQVLRGAGVTTYQVVDVSEGRLAYRSYLADTAPDATTNLPVGSVYDEFTVSKTDDGRKWVAEAGLEPQPIDDASLLMDANRGDVTAPTTAAPGERITVGLGASRSGAGAWVWIHSEPTLLGAVAADAAGRIRVTVPAGITEGDHRVVIRATDGSLVGWAPVHVSASAATGQEVGSIASPGEAPAALWLVGALLMLAPIVIALGVRRRRRMSDTASTN
jgi:hypothetical protein